MKKLALTSLLISQLCLPSLLMADDENGEAPPSPVIGNVVTMRAPDGSIEQPVLSQPGPADDMLFNRLHPEVKAPEKKVPVIALQVDGIENGQRIPDKYVYCAPDGNGGTINGGNVSPAIHWQDLPADTKSLVLMVVDTDVPAKLDDANKPGIEIRARAPRQDFYHWIVTGISPSSLGWFEGASSNGVTPGGKPPGRHAYGIDELNDFSRVFNGTYGGYDGPCPPWNDLRMHHYHFILYALDIGSLGLPHPIRPLQAKSAMQDHIIGKGEVVGTYTTNPRWLAQFKREKEMKEDPNMRAGARFDPNKQ